MSKKISLETKEKFARTLNSFNYVFLSKLALKKIEVAGEEYYFFETCHSVPHFRRPCPFQQCILRGASCELGAVRNHLTHVLSLKVGQVEVESCDSVGKFITADEMLLVQSSTVTLWLV